MDKVSKIPIYLYKECVTDLVQAVEYSEQINCNVLVTSITNPQFRREFHHQPLCRSHIRFTRSELMLEPSKWVSQVVTKLSNTIDCDSANEHVRKSSEQTIKQEISFAQHVAHQMLIKINGTNTSNLARTICAELSGSNEAIQFVAFYSFNSIEITAGTLLVEMPMIHYETPLMDIHDHNDENGPKTIETWYW